ncbi:DUF1330 domain-containing protein [Pseudomonas sp. NCHU5208]|uniref:DUF1330 domain-containing protein n=1 Tax=unclassified Pseudomonas TaxID=196821 RepID=UPI003F969088
MPLYAIAQLDIHDRSRYGRYQARFMEVFRRYQGCLLAADEQPRLIEGTWPYQKLVLMTFPDEQAFRQCAESAEYRRIAEDRTAGATTTVLLVHGLADR